MKLHRLVTLPAMVAIAGLTMLPQAVASSSHEQGNYVFPYGPEISYCGEPFEQEGVDTGRYQIVAKGADGLPHFQVQAKSPETWTNTITGEYVAVEIHYTGNDIAVIDNGDGTLTQVVQFTGVTAMYDESGAVLGRSAGSGRVSFVFDHAGTPADTSDDEFVSRTVLMSTGLTFDFCGTIAAAIG
jgi:hypothetical protein